VIEHARVSQADGFPAPLSPAAGRSPVTEP
jgi:hypothetical protein